MKTLIKPGKYVVAVSGGVDSVVLLDMLSKQKGLDLIVAHFDHGIRQESAEDRQFVESLAKKYNLGFEYTEGKLGSKASEDEARSARYDFLHGVRKKHGASAIVTAHHQDDVLETLIFNVLRGSGRKGGSSLGNSDDIIRPLLNITKQQIKEYAIKNKLTWHEDSTNSDESYTRNWIRAQIVSKMKPEEKQSLLASHKKLKAINEELDQYWGGYLSALADPKQLDKGYLTSLPHNVGCELVAVWLRSNDISDFDKKTIERVVIGAKTLADNKKIDVMSGVHVLIGPASIALESKKLPTMRKSPI